MAYQTHSNSTGIKLINEEATCIYIHGYKYIHGYITNNVSNFCVTKILLITAYGGGYITMLYIYYKESFPL